MTCNQIQEKLLYLIDKEIPSEIRRHLKECAECERKNRIFQGTEETLRDLGEAIRSGANSMAPPPFPSIRQRSFWTGILSQLKTPAPIWAPSAVCLTVLLLGVSVYLIPLNLPIEWGAQKGGQHVGQITPPLSAEGMLEFLIVPDQSDAAQLSASIETVESFLKTHPDDIAMHVKIVELYQARLRLGSLTETERKVLEKKLELNRKSLLKLMNDFAKEVDDASN